MQLAYWKPLVFRIIKHKLGQNIHYNHCLNLQKLSPPNHIIYPILGGNSPPTQKTWGDSPHIPPRFGRGECDTLGKLWQML